MHALAHKGSPALLDKIGISVAAAVMTR
jgi:hypothetical protein